MTSWLDNIEDRVIAAYRAHGWKPGDCSFVGEEYRCALGALYALVPLANGRYVEEIGRISGAEFAEIWNFIYQFDSEVLYHREKASQPPKRPVYKAEAAARRVVERLIAEGLL